MGTREKAAEIVGDEKQSNRSIECMLEVKKARVKGETKDT